MLHLCWVSSFAWAEMVATDAVVQSQTETSNPRQRLLDLLNREEVQTELEQYGISQVEAVMRINSLTDAEVTEIAGKLDQLPPGGYGEVIIIAGYLAIYIFFLFPGLLFYCPFSDDSYGKCISKYSGKYWDSYKGAGDGRDGGYADTSPAYESCVLACKSDFNSCMGDTDGIKSEEQECEDDKNICDKKCSDYANGTGGFFQK